MVLLPAALAVAAVGFFWLAGAALPYQDPTPEMLIAQEAEVQNTQWLLLAGASVAVADAVWLWKTRQRPH